MILAFSTIYLPLSADYKSDRIVGDPYWNDIFVLCHYTKLYPNPYSRKHKQTFAFIIRNVSKKLN